MNLDALLRPLRRQLDNLIARAMIRVVNDAAGVQTMQVSALAGETREGCERLQQFGFTSVPLAGAEAVVVFVGGHRDHGYVIACDDRRFRKTNLQPGEAAAYNSAGDYLLLRLEHVIETGSAMQATSFRVAGQKVLGTRGAPILDPVAGTTVDAEARAAIGAILAAMRTHGMIG